MSRDLLLRFVDDRAALTEAELAELARALAADAGLCADARALVATDELIDRALAPRRRGFAARVADALAAGRTAVDGAPSPTAVERSAPPRANAPLRGGARRRDRAASRRMAPRRAPIAAFAIACAAAAVVALLLRPEARATLDATARPWVVAALAAHRGGTADGRPLRAGDVLDASDLVAVEAGGRVDLAYPDGSTMTLGALERGAALRIEASEVIGTGRGAEADRPASLDQHAESAAEPTRRGAPSTGAKTITLLTGLLSAHVMPQPSDAPLTIRTDEASCVVVGTRFSVARAGAGSPTRLAVDEGAVAMRARDGATITVHAGEAGVADGRSLSLATTPPGSDGSPATPPTKPARTRAATPATLAALAADLRPGDTLTLAAGAYDAVGLRLGAAHGEPDAWITITGPAEGEAVLHARAEANTIELGGAHHLVLRRLSFAGDRRSGAYAIAAHDPAGGATHDIRIEDCAIRDYAGWPEARAISTKVPAWSWTIRGCVIERCGGGLHLGSTSDDAPFVAGTIAGDLIAVDDAAIVLAGAGAWPAGAPAGRPTVIADDVLVRAAGASAPLITLEGGATEASGARCRVELARDLLVAEGGDDALVMAAGAVDLHDCLLVGGAAAAIRLRTRGAPTDARLWHDTVVGGTEAVHLPDEPCRALIASCVLCAQTPVVGGDARLVAVVRGARADAARLLVAPTAPLGALDLHPLRDACRSEAWDATALGLDARDFDGTMRGDTTIPGAYAGTAASGWRLDAQRKPVVDR